MIDINELRSRFPALKRTVGDRRAVYLDGPAGTQVSQTVIDRVSTAMVESVSNVGGPFPSSRDTDRVVAEARAAAADFFDADAKVVFGANMTSITFAFSRAVAESWTQDDVIVVTRLDHDANVTPWVRVAEESGAEVRFADINDDATLDHASLAQVLDDSVALVAVTGCSNAFGTLVDIPSVVEAAHGVGAKVYVDAVHLAPHHRPLVPTLRADAVVCSSYKFYGPHLGMLWGDRAWLEEIDAVKVRPAPAEVPGRFETGTQPFPLLAGLTATVDHLASLGNGDTRRDRLTDAFEWIQEREHDLGSMFLEALPDNVTVVGPAKMSTRVSTFAVSVAGVSPAEAAGRLGEQGIFVWPGHNYAIEPMRRLGYLDHGGLVRIGISHLNTDDEIQQVCEALAGLQG